jgi:hypothetical protein
LALFVGLTADVWALPVTVTQVHYDDARRRLTLDVSSDAEIRTRQDGRRIILEIPDAKLRGKTFAQNVQGRRVRSVLVTEVPGSPASVRIELALVPGVEPFLSVEKAGGRIYVVLADAPRPEGERDDEEMPVRPRGTLPQLSDRSNRPARPAPQVVAVPGATPAPGPTRLPGAVPEAGPTPEAQPFGVARVAAPTPRAPKAELQPGTRNFAILSLMQTDAAELVPGKRLKGFPTGPAGLDVQQWLFSYLGVGLEARFFDWQATGDLTLPRQDGLMVLRLGGRLPLPYVEPDLYVGGAARFQAFGGKNAFDPPAFALGGALRLQPADALGLKIWGQLYPLGIGFDQVWRAGLVFLIDAGPAVLSAGFTHDDLTVTGGKVTFDAAVLGAGLQW